MNGQVTDSSPEASHGSAGVLLPALARLGVPILLFGSVFLLLSFLLTFLVSPDRFPVRVGDKIVRLAELQAEENDLKKKQSDLMEERALLLKNSDAPVLTQVQKIRKDIDPIGLLLFELERVRRSFMVGEVDPIRLPRVEFDAGSHTLTIGGEVTDPGGRSVSILSAFVDALRKLPMLQSASGKTAVSEPSEYAQKVAENGTATSAFTIVITLPRE